MDIDKNIVDKFNSTLQSVINDLNTNEYNIFKSIITELNRMDFGVVVTDTDNKKLFELCINVMKDKNSKVDIDDSAFEFVLNKLVHNTYLIYKEFYISIANLYNIKRNDSIKYLYNIRLSHSKEITHLSRILLHHLYFTSIEKWDTRNG